MSHMRFIVNGGSTVIYFNLITINRSELNLCKLKTEKKINTNYPNFRELLTIIGLLIRGSGPFHLS